MAKRFLALLLCFALCLSLLPASFAEDIEIVDPEEMEETLPEEEIAVDELEQTYPAPDAEPNGEIIASGECGDNLTWTLDDEGTLTISGTGSMWNYTYNLYSGIDAPWASVRHEICTIVICEGVTHIGSCIFGFCDSMTVVTIPDSVSSIGNGAFMQCNKLTNVVLPKGIVEVSEDSFRECSSLTSISIPEGVTHIEARALYRCSGLNDVQLPNSIWFMGEDAFSRCKSLSSITIPTSVTYVGERCFRECDDLNEIRFEGPAPTFCENCFGNVTATAYYPTDDPSWTESVRQDYGGTLTWVAYSPEPPIVASGQCGDDLTWELYDDGMLKIGGTGNMWDYSQWGDAPWYDHRASIQTVDICEGVTSIGHAAFALCNEVTEVSLPGSLRTIGCWAFVNCNKLSEITLPEGLVSISGGSFGRTDLHEVTFPATLQVCQKGDTGDAVFFETPLEQIDVSPDNPWFCSVEGVVYSKDQSEVVMFPNGRTGSYTVPDGVTSVGMKAFDGVKLTEVNLPDTLTSINSLAFQFAWDLTSITVPAGVTSIRFGAFALNGLKTVVFEGSAPIFSEDCFHEVAIAAYYPKDDPSWTEDVRQQYGGTIEWVPYGSTTGALTLSESSISLPVFEGRNLRLTDANDVAAIANWKSSNNTVATVSDFGTVTAHKYGKCTITATVNGKSYDCQVQTLFWDVADSSKYYFKHVYWAAEKGITKGYDLEYFDPQGTCTREQMMTFLWRLAGQPNPKTTSSPFPDVKSGAYYYKAVLWGVEKKITAGFSEGEYAGKFGVGLACTREQAMTFLWRMAGKPNPKTTNNPFSDVKSSDYFFKAVLWASENKIANGYDGGYYGVGYTCLREHMVTFLSRYASKFM